MGEMRTGALVHRCYGSGTRVDMDAYRRTRLAASFLLCVLSWSACGGTALVPSSGDGGAGGGDSGAAPVEGPTQRACTPGQQIACACAGIATMGAQDCNPDGQGFGPCTGCPSSGSPDASAGHDGAADASGHASGQGFDGTTGLPCTTSADCRGTVGPGINVCSNSLTYSANAMIVNPLPTPVCMLPPAAAGAGNCDPAPASDPSGQLPHFCDGPDSPSSPGICIPSGTTAHAGTCSPMCIFSLDGSMPVGCVGKDTCVETPFIALDSSSQQLFGWGDCFGSCQKTSDCSALGAGYICQIDTGFCTASPVTRSKQLGQACTSNDSTTGACNCLTPPSTGSGYCTSACVIGGAPCPNGWICDTLQSASPTIGGTVFTVHAENSGMSGMCVAPCNAPDGGPAQCPSPSTCKTGSPVGPDCLP
jgi:hypothetical protein